MENPYVIAHAASQGDIFDSELYYFLGNFFLVKVVVIDEEGREEDTRMLAKVAGELKWQVPQFQNTIVKKRGLSAEVLLHDLERRFYKEGGGF